MEGCLDHILDQLDRYATEDRESPKQVWCGWGHHYVPVEDMVSPFSFECKACHAAFEADCREVEAMFREFGGAA